MCNGMCRYETVWTADRSEVSCGGRGPSKPGAACREEGEAEDGYEPEWEPDDD